MVKNKLKEIRMKEYMMNQKEFSEILKIDYRQYNRYEKGIVPSLETAINISLSLKKHIEEIFYI